MKWELNYFSQLKSDRSTGMELAGDISVMCRPAETDSRTCFYQLCPLLGYHMLVQT